MHTMLRSVVIVVAVLSAACGRSDGDRPATPQSEGRQKAEAPPSDRQASAAPPRGDPASPEDCAQRTKRLEDWVARYTSPSEIARTEARVRFVYGAKTTERWAAGGSEYDDQLRLPLVTRAVREVDRESVQLLVKAGRTIHFPAPEPYFGDEKRPVYSEKDVNGRLRRSLRRHLKRGTPLVILADRTVLASLVGRVLAALPRGATARLAVRKPAASFIADHVASFPYSPGWLTPILQDAYAERGHFFMMRHPGLASALTRAAGGCPEGLQLFEWVKQGAPVEVGLPKFVEVARGCGCRDMDVEAIASVYLLFADPRTWAGFLDLPAASLDGLDPSATVQDLADALATAQP
jgi:hypothetical protein